MVLWLLACERATPPPSSGTPPATEVETLVLRSSYFGDRIEVVDRETGEPVGRIRGVDGAQTVAVAPDGTWVACAEEANALVVLDPATLEVGDALVADDPETPDDETGGLVHPDGATFGPDGRLYVASFETDQVLRYEADGTFVDVFVAAGAGGLNGPDLAPVFGPDGSLYVPGWYSHAIHRYSAEGEWLEDVLTADDGLTNPRVVALDAAGALYVTAHGSNAVLRKTAAGEVTRLIERERVTGMVLDEARGELLLTDDRTGRIEVRELATGALLDTWRKEVDSATALAVVTRAAAR